MSSDVVSDCLIALRDGLEEICTAQWKKHYGPSWQATIHERNRFAVGPPNPHDLQWLLRGMTNSWQELWRSTLDEASRGYVSEILSVRNRWAHQDPISEQDVSRLIDTAVRLLNDIGADAASRRVSALVHQQPALPVITRPSPPAVGQSHANEALLRHQSTMPPPISQPQTAPSQTQSEKVGDRQSPTSRVARRESRYAETGFPERFLYVFELCDRIVQGHPKPALSAGGSNEEYWLNDLVKELERWWWLVGMHHLPESARLPCKEAHAKVLALASEGDDLRLQQGMSEVRSLLIALQQLLSTEQKPTTP